MDSMSSNRTVAGLVHKYIGTDYDKIVNALLNYPGSLDGNIRYIDSDPTKPLVYGGYYKVLANHDLEMPPITSENDGQVIHFVADTLDWLNLGTTTFCTEDGVTFADGQLISSSGAFVTAVADYETMNWELGGNSSQGLDGTGIGDMVKAVYDTNNSGSVNNAEKVNELTVETAVPPNAVFTDSDTTYTEIDFDHNQLVNYDEDEHIDWSVTNAKNVHPSNYVSNTTQALLLAYTF